MNMKALAATIGVVLGIFLISYIASMSIYGAFAVMGVITYFLLTLLYSSLKVYFEEKERENENAQ